MDSFQTLTIQIPDTPPKNEIPDSPLKKRFKLSDPVENYLEANGLSKGQLIAQGCFGVISELSSNTNNQPPSVIKTFKKNAHNKCTTPSKKHLCGEHIPAASANKNANLQRHLLQTTAIYVKPNNEATDQWKPNAQLTLVALIMEKGESDLGTFLNKSQLSNDEKFILTKNVLKAVASLKEANIVHRDLKPANFLVDKALNVKIIDFGKAKQIGDEAMIPHSPNNTGTISYTAPEAFGREKSDLLDVMKLDPYSVGALLYQIYEGKGLRTPDPFEAAVFSLENVSFSESTPKNIQEAIKSLVEPNPNERSDVQSVLSKLKNSQDSSSNSSTNPSSNDIPSHKSNE